jgi:hypothetical protein
MTKIILRQAMHVQHRFEALSMQDGGKEHLFTWKDAEGAHLLHAMYQSGDDALLLSDGSRTKRGQVLRLQPIEEPSSFAPSEDAKNGVIALQVDSEGWKETNYQHLAQRIKTEFGFNKSQQTAAFAQLASLYNLMATRYGQTFTVGSDYFAQDPVRPLLADDRLSELSRWAEQHAVALKHGDTIPPSLTLPPIDKPDARGFTFSHGIEAVEGGKRHDFEWKIKNNKMISAYYQSGPWGENLWVEYPLYLSKQEASIIIPYNLTERATSGKTDIVPAEEQLHRIRFHTLNYLLAPEQQAATLFMMASLHRLLATHYQGAYEPKAVDDVVALRSYIRDGKHSQVAEELTELGIQRLLYTPYNAPMKYCLREARDAANGETWLQQRIAEFETLTPGKPMIDTSLMPLAKYEQATTEWLANQLFPEAKGFVFLKNKMILKDTQNQARQK